MYDSNQELKELSNVYRQVFNIPLQPIDIGNDEEKTGDMIMYRFMVSFTDLKEAGALKPGKYSLEFKFLKKSVKIGFLKENNVTVIPIRKTYVFHCFAHDQSNWVQYITNKPVIYI